MKKNDKPTPKPIHQRIIDEGMLKKGGVRPTIPAPKPKEPPKPRKK